MSKITRPNAAHISYEGDRKSHAGFLTLTFNKFLESRSREAQRRISVYLDGLDVGRLGLLGLTAADIAAIRTGEPLSSVLARQAYQAI